MVENIFEDLGKSGASNLLSQLFVLQEYGFGSKNVDEIIKLILDKLSMEK